MAYISEVRESADGITKVGVYRRDLQVIEVRHVTGRGDKDILCVPSHYGCPMNCRFCSGPSGSSHDGIAYGVLDPIITEYYQKHVPEDRKILVSFMGCGEPLLNWENILETCSAVRWDKSRSFQFAIATMLPRKIRWEFPKFVERVAERSFKLKLHLSLHFTNDETREEWMPGAMSILESIACLEWYHRMTGNPVEVHYMMIDHVNEYLSDQEHLIALLSNRPGLSLKLLKFNPVAGESFRPASQHLIDNWVRDFKDHGIPTEYYVTDGVDIKAACGMFDTSLYGPDKPRLRPEDFKTGRVQIPQYCNGTYADVKSMECWPDNVAIYERVMTRDGIRILYPNGFHHTTLCKEAEKALHLDLGGSHATQGI